ncbi:MAG: hydrogenase maturation protease [Actinobacteria bacterium HGW-Actinobacteria-2]|nr:MAG: hydrogenase maturation protease [Actinobacteria bacterium HGW-Actinobacteria-2]
MTTPATSRVRPDSLAYRPPFEPAVAPITVLGVGNLIMGDDSIGLVLLERLQESLDDPRIAFVDGATGGMELLPVVQEATRLLILDAVAGPVPGTVVTIDGDQVPRLLATKLSPHQVGLLDLFAAARMLGTEPSEVTVVGIVPGHVDLTLNRTEAVTGALDEAVERATAVLTDWLAALDAEG